MGIFSKQSGHIQQNHHGILSFFLLKYTLIIILAGIMLVVNGIFFQGTKSNEKFACETDADCIVSYTDTEGFEMCVNTDYHAKAPKTDGYLCLKTPDLSCQCRANRCERSDNTVMTCK